ncbi:hypothetical protein [Aquamicrobium soli]|uniref:Uncharacterized protein n=1 Tax=Aquamicrobium soli TaxID=1811518 RepID=A0ABV7KBX1_9HYPH
MVDAPDRIWSIGSESPYRINCSILDHAGEPGCTEYLRADIAASQLAEKQKQLDELPSKALWDESRKALASMRNEVGELKRQLAEARAERDRFSELYAREAHAHMVSREFAEAERDRLAADNARLREALEGLLEVHEALGAGNSYASRKARAALAAGKE